MGRALEAEAVELVLVILRGEVSSTNKFVAVALAFGGREDAVLAAAE